MSDTDPVFRLIYRSRSTIPRDERSETLAAIFDVARTNNKRSGVTGALLVTDNWFVQALEGEESVVDALYERIRADSRHVDVDKLETSTSDPRVFSRWSMAQVRADGRSDIPLHDVGGRIHAAAASAPDRAQRAVLDRMRNAVGADTV